MIFKIAIFVAIIFIIYLLFFKKKSVNGENNNNSRSEEMVECKKCGTFISVHEAITTNGDFYCSKKCIGGKK